MPKSARFRSRPGVACAAVLASLLMLLAAGAPALRAAEPVPPAVEAVVKVRTFVAPEARTAKTLGTTREGNGVVIDADGLVVTIGYLIIEAMGAELVGADGKAVRAEIVGYDGDTGFGLVRATAPLAVRPATLGRARRVKEGERVTIAGHGGPDAVQPAILVSRREFAGYWEYLLDEALFVSPPHPNWGGAALFAPDGALIGIGSLLVGQVAPGVQVPGNMFVPIDLLPAVMGDLLALGRPGGAGKPWIGINAQEGPSGLVVTRVQPDSPAEKAGLSIGDVIQAVGSARVGGLADFYRKMWATGDPGVTVSLRVRSSDAVREVAVRTADRRRYLKSDQSY